MEDEIKAGDLITIVFVVSDETPEEIIEATEKLIKYARKRRAEKDKEFEEWIEAQKNGSASLNT